MSQYLTIDNGTADSRLTVLVLTADSRRALSRAVAALNWRDETGCGADCTGKIFMQSARLLRAYRATGGHWRGVVESCESFDV